MSNDLIEVGEYGYVKRMLATFVMLSAFAGLMILGWYAYDEARNPKDLSNLPIIKASPEPFKVKPLNPGGMDVPNTDKIVFNVISDNKKDVIDDTIEKLLPPPEEPVDKEKFILEVKEREQKEAEDAKIAAKLLNIEQEVIEAEQTSLSEKQSAAKITIAQKAPEKNTKTDIAEDNLFYKKQFPVFRPIITTKKRNGKKITIVDMPYIPFKPFGNNAASIDRKIVVQKTEISAEIIEPAIDKKEPIKKKKATVGIAIQLGSYKTTESLEKGWETLQTSFPNLLGKLEHKIQPVELASRGVFYRLHAYPLKSRDAASKVCKKLTAKKQGCLIVR